MARPIPVNREIAFGIDELFFSRTDLRGIIRSGNDVFARVSAYPREVLTGSAHNLVRHPDMPKAVFRVMWDTIKAGKPFSGYVKNLAGDGSYYWVFATAFPIEDGYLSIRIKPSTEAFKLVQPLYQKVLEREKKDGVEASVTFLLELLSKEGFKDYESFMNGAIVAEISARARQLSSVNEALAREAGAADGSRRQLREIAIRCAESARENSAISAKLEHFAEMNRMLVEKSAFVMRSLQSVDLLSVNMSTAAKRIGAAGVTLVAVANGIRKVAGEFKDDLVRFNESSARVQASIRTAEFRISTSQLQVDMIDFYVKEVLRKWSGADAAGNDLSDMRENSKHLLGLSVASARNLRDEMLALRGVLQQIAGDVEQLRATINGLEIIRKTGGIEAAQIAEGAQFQAHFTAMNELVRETGNQLGTFGDFVSRSLQDIELIMPALGRIAQVLGELEALNAKLE